jgi:hypothetical protein
LKNQETSRFISSNFEEKVVLNMEKKSFSTLASLEEFKQRTEKLITPIDFDQLINDGIIEKKRGWYKIINFQELPAHAKAKIRTAKTVNGETFVKFVPPSKRLAKMLESFK